MDLLVTSKSAKYHNLGFPLLYDQIPGLYMRITYTDFPLYSVLSHFSRYQATFILSEKGLLKKKIICVDKTGKGTANLHLYLLLMSRVAPHYLHDGVTPHMDVWFSCMGIWRITYIRCSQGFKNPWKKSKLHIYTEVHCPRTDQHLQKSHLYSWLGWLFLSCQNKEWEKEKIWRLSITNMLGVILE